MKNLSERLAALEARKALDEPAQPGFVLIDGELSLDGMPEPYRSERLADYEAYVLADPLDSENRIFTIEIRDCSKPRSLRPG